MRYHLAGWDTVCTPIAKGGFRVRKLVTFNQALSGKWLSLCVELLWRQVVAAKYGEDWGA